MNQRLRRSLLPSIPRLVTAVVIAALLAVPVGAAAQPRQASVIEPTPTASATPSASPTASATPTPTPTPTPSVSPSATPSPSPTPTADPTPIATPTPTPSATPAPTPTPTPDADVRDAADAQIEAEPGGAVVPTTSRLSGGSRTERAVLASRAAFPDGAETVIVVNRDAKAAGVLAGSLALDRAAPVLLVGAGGVPSAVRTEVARLAPARIIAFGSRSDFTSAGISALARLAPVTRISYSALTEASRKVLDARADPVDTVYLTGRDLRSQALAISLAATRSSATLLVEGGQDTAGSAAIAVLQRAGATRVVIVGGASQVTSGYAQGLRDAGFSVTRRSHSDTLQLSLQLARLAAEPSEAFYAVNPTGIWDVAIGASVAAATRQPMVFTHWQCMYTRTADYIADQGARVVGIGKTYWLAKAVVDNTACRDERPRLEGALRSAMQTTANGYDGVFAFTVVELSGLRERAEMRGSTRLEPASMMKLFAAYAALRRIQDGYSRWDTKPRGTSLRTCLKVMIHASDNYCHDDIVNWLGPVRLTRIIHDLGYSNTSYGDVPAGGAVLYAGNLSTTNDLANFVRRLDAGELLSPSLTRVLKDYMHAQIFRTRIPSGIPADAYQASKPGALWISSGLLQADTAIVKGPRTSFALSIIATGGVPKRALSALARTAYTHLNGGFGAAATYPVEQMRSTRSTAMRSSPGGSSVGTLPAGRNIEVLDAHRVWYQVRYGSRTVWVDSRALRNR